VRAELQEAGPTMGTLLGTGVRLAVLWAALAILAGLALPAAQAQTGVSSVGPRDASPAGVAAPEAGITAADPPATEEGRSPGGVLPSPLPLDSGSAPFRVVTTPFDVICESIFGEASADEWQPLELSTFFTKGWHEPYAKSPEGTKGAPKQNWFGSADGIFSRLNSLDFFYTNGLTNHRGLLLSPFPWAPVKPDADGNQYWASYNLYLPLNQRLELLVVVPFVASNKSSPTGHYVANFGDLTISERLRLVEQRNFTFQALFTQRTPTGRTVNGNDINYITPSIEFWWNFAPKWVVRGGTGINIDTGRTSATSTYFNNVAFGRYLTSKDAPVFKHLVAHVAVSTMSDVLGRKGHITEVYIAPGVRFGLDSEGKWAVLAAVQTPVAGPNPYAYQVNFALSRNY
jgi:hypothetical protein